MKGIDFKKWAEISHQSYGKDTWFFIRELAQNSRDAGATAIEVEAFLNSNDQEVLTFTDNGSGMDFSHARQYLFRLYASSKTKEKFSAGMFGAGFWTILRYNPEMVVIESMTGGGKWAINLGQDLQISSIPCTLHTRGTRISLIRHRHFQTTKDFKSRAKKALIKYCQYLRKSDTPGNRLPVIYQGEDISKPMRLPGPFTHHFRKGPLEGAIGLGSEPKVELYAKGLPVWEGTTIDELSHTYSANVPNYEVGSGLAPVFLLNGNNLDVNITRKSVIDNQALKKLRETAKKNLSKLIVSQAEEAFPRSLGTIISDFFSQIKYNFGFSKWKLVILALIVIVPLEYIMLKNFFPVSRTTNNPSSILSVSENGYTGATVQMGQPQSNDHIRYSPPVPAWLRLFTASKYNIGSGFVNADQQPLKLPPDQLIDKNQRPIVLELRIEHGGRIYLPQPTGYLIEANSLTFAGERISGLRYTSSYEAIISLPLRDGVLKYQCLPMRQNISMPAEYMQRWTELPPRLKFPSYQKTRLDAISASGSNEKIKSVISMIISELQYDTSEMTATQYKKMASENLDWLSMVQQIGKGDCDVLNSVCVVYLRYLQIPARLVIGFIGKSGNAAAGLHAWTEYYDNGWKLVDVSQVAAVSSSHSKVNPAPAAKDTDGSLDDLLGTTGSHTRSLGYLLFTGGFFLLFIWLVVLFFRRGRKDKNPQTIQHIRSTLIQMAVRAILQPEVWGYDSQIWKYRIIPTIQNKNISLKAAFLLAGKHKLFTATPQNPLVKSLLKKRFTVLNHLTPEYHSLIQLIPGKIDIDLIHSLKPFAPQHLPLSSITSLLREVNQRLKSIIGIEDFCLLAQSLTSQQLLEIKIPISTQYNGHPLPKHFLIINPTWNRLTAWGELFKINPPLAIFKTISQVIHETKSLRIRHTTILNRLAKNLVRTIK